jgi:5-formyltetrahydrofolate cyclo-ligase
MAAKDALRRTMGAQLAALSPAEIASQSAGVLSQLLQLPFYLSARSASVYLPMDRGCEVNTWPIIADLLGRGATVAVPRVVGPAPGDMEMLAIRTIEEAQAFPRTKWGIPEPDDAAAATMERLTDVPLDLILVPGVAFDAQCNRLGHGRGYYDTFLARQRAAAEAVTSSSDAGAATSRTDATIVGLALTPQLVVRVPTGEHDERLQFIVHPAGRLAYTSAADAAGAAALFGGSNGAVAASGGAASSPAAGVSASAGAAALATSTCRASTDFSPPIDELVDVAKGVYKYACVRVSGDGRGGRDPSYIVVRSGRGDYHSHVAKPVVDRYRRQGLIAVPLGGGRISFTDSVSGSAKIHIYGFSVGFGGDEGGPPGTGMSDHVEVARLVALRYPDAAVTFSPDGY